VTNQPDPQFGGREYPPIEHSPSTDPLAPLDYPADAGLPPPLYPTQSPGPVGYPQPYPPAAYPGYPSYPSYGYPPHRGTSGMAIGALVCSALGLVVCLPAPIGVILGVMAMRETKRTGQEGYGLALAAVIVGGLITAGIVLYILFLIVMVAISGTH
jgi:hypothetical protein